MITQSDDILNVASLALDIKWGQPEDNLNAVEKYAEKLPDGIDLLVVPELFTTGFIQDKTLLLQLSETDDGATISRMSALANRRNMAVAGSYSALDDGKVYNRAFFIDPEGHLTIYNKRHLFSLSAESSIYTGGTDRIPVVNYRGWNIGLTVCYDLRFPVWNRNVRHAYDMMLVPANWPQARGYAWSHLLIARAIENQAVYVGADRSGFDDYGVYDGLSQIYDAMGMPIGQALDGVPEIMTASPSLTEIRKARRRLPVSDSADDFEILCKE